MVLLEALHKTMHHKYVTAFYHVHCVPLSIFKVTQLFPVLKVTYENTKKIYLYLTNS